MTLTNPIARPTDPHSSHEAAAHVNASGRRESHVAKVTNAVRAKPGHTGREVARMVGLDYHETMRRLNDAVKRGVISKGPARHCRLGGWRAVTTWWPV